MKQHLVFVVLVSGWLACTLYAGNDMGADRLPDFSWDTVPRYMHVRKATSFTPEEIRYLASFPLITFEKTTGMKDAGSTEKGTLLAAQAVKAINPRAKILYYRNILVHYTAYDADAALDAIPGALLSDQNGNTKLIRNRVAAYDLSNPGLQAWWLDHAKAVCGSPYIDGLFVDGNIKVLEPGYLRKELGAAKKAAIEKAYHEMMGSLHETLGLDKLVIANIIRARFTKGGLEYLDYFDGSYIEGFEHAVGGMSRETYMANGIEAIQTAARKGKVIAFTMGMGKAQAGQMGIDESRSQITDLAAMQPRFKYALGIFLICAEKYSYFLAHDGYGVDGGRNRFWMQDFPEYSRALGPPKGPAIEAGWTYTREFEHAQVTLDIQNQQAQIIWEE
jgi:hypothetical protein